MLYREIFALSSEFDTKIQYTLCSELRIIECYTLCYKCFLIITLIVGHLITKPFARLI